MSLKSSVILNIVLGVMLVVTVGICIASNGAHEAEDILATAEVHDRGSDFTLVHDLYAYSDEYLNTKVAITGIYSNSLVQEDGTIAEPEDNETVYHFLTVFDTAGDCFFTIEFTSASGEYPAFGDLIYASGVFSEYTEDDSKYVTIMNSDWALVESGTSSSSEIDVDTASELDNIGAQEPYDEKTEESTGVTEAS